MDDFLNLPRKARVKDMEKTPNFLPQRMRSNIFIDILFIYYTFVKLCYLTDDCCISLQRSLRQLALPSSPVFDLR